MSITFASVRLVTDDVARLVAFYEQVTGVPARWATDQFAEVVTGAATLAIAGTGTLALFGSAIARSADNHTAILEFRVPDVDAEHERLSTALDLELVQAPATMPWGNRSLLFRDPDGSLVNLYTPVTAAALARFER